MSLTNTPDILVNGCKILASKIDAEIQYYPASTRREAMIQAAESLIIEELLSQKAKQKGLIQTASDKFADNHPDLVDKLISQEANIPECTETECRRYFESNRDKFTSAPLVEAKHILLAADPQNLEERAKMQQIAETLLAQLRQDIGQFSRFAKSYSACPSKEVGGNLGQVSNGQTVPEFQRQLFAADAGLMASPIESRFGYHLVFIQRKVEGILLPYEQVKVKIQHYLNDKVQRKAIAQYLHRLVSEADIQGFEFDLSSSPLMQ